jgi:transcriptional regulator with XRE-family HTH domain
MKISRGLSDRAVLGELGSRLAAVRLGQNLTQARLAEQAGVSKRTIERLETGTAGTQLSGFLRVCRALDLLEGLESLVPEPMPSPLAALARRGRARRRASTRVARRAPSAKWTWGDES